MTVNRALRALPLAGVIERQIGSGSCVRAQPERKYSFGLLIPDLGQNEIFEPICRDMALAEETEPSLAQLWSKALSDSEPKEMQATGLCQHSLLPFPPTKIHQPCGKMGAAAVAAILQRIRNPDLPGIFC